MNHGRCRLGVVVTVLMGGIGDLGAARAASPNPAPAVLFVGTYGGDCSFELAGRLRQAGFAVDHVPYPGLEGQPLSWEQLRRYNVVVLMGLGRANADMTLTPRNQQSIEALQQFLAAGGGVFAVPVFGQMATEKPAQDAFYGPLGLTPLYAEIPADPESEVVATAWKLPYALTRNIVPSPITDGVRSLWYPVLAYRVGGQNHTIPLSVDGSWTVVVKGSPSSHTLGGPLQANNPTDPGTYPSEVPLAAFREVGKGRMAALGIAPQYLFSLTGTTTLESIVLDRGLQGVPSDGYRLIENALRWLAEPSLAEGSLGGAPMRETLLENPYRTRFSEPYRWPAKVTFPPIEKAFPGVIGARTRYSTGKATAEEWVQAARSQGLAYLVFLEDFRALSPEEFAQLKADCARLSSGEFTAIPGFTIDDEIGNHYFYFGTTLPYPDRKFLSPEGTFFVSRDPEINPENPYVPGQLSMTTLDYAYSISGFKLTAGNYLFSRDAAPFANFFSNWDAFGVITAQGGKVVEDATRDFLWSVDFGNGPLPVVVDLMDDPVQLGRSGWRTVLRLPEQGGAVIGPEPLGKDTQVRDYFNGWRFYPDNPTKIYITSGPEIESWCYVGPRDYEGNTAGDFVWQNYRWLVRGRTGAAAGLKEVAIYDGEALFRRFLPRGQRTFEFTLDLTHDQQHNLVLVATDRQGRRAISGEQWDRNHRLEEFMCSDRNNQLSYGYLTKKDGIGLLLGGNQTLATPNKRIMPGISPAGTFKNDPLLGAPAFDGAAGGEPEVFEAVAMLLPSGEQPAPDVSESRRLFHSRDLHVGEGQREYRFADKVGVYNVWHTLWRTEAADDFTVRRRNSFFQVHPDSPLAVFLWQIDVALRRDQPNNGFRIAILASRQDARWLLRDSTGATREGVWEEPASGASEALAVPFGKGAWVAFLDSPLGGAVIYSLTDGLRLTMTLPGRHNAVIDLPAEAAPQKKGQSRRVELLIVGIPRETDATRTLPFPSMNIVKRFTRDFAMAGGSPGYTVAARAGRVAGQRYPLEVNGAKEGCFSGVLRGHLVSSLPIAVAGLHDAWSCYLYERSLQRARPVGVFEGKGWATVCLEGSLDLFVGHPMVADNPQVALQVTQTGEQSWKVEVHNPTNAPITTTLRKNPYFDPLQKKPFRREILRVPAGTSVWRTL